MLGTWRKDAPASVVYTDNSQAPLRSHFGLKVVLRGHAKSRDLQLPEYKGVYKP